MASRKSVLIIDESPLFRDYLAEKLESYGLVVIKALNGVDGAGKITHHRPDLVISDYYLSQRDLLTILKAKQSDVTTADIPVIVISSRVSRDKLLELAQFSVKKFFTKPLKIDLLWQAITEILGIKIELDETPCILEAHVNEDIVFVEVAMGLNLEKINMLEFKVKELLNIHTLEIPKFLVMFSSLEVREQDKVKIRRLFDILVAFTRGRIKWVKVLTQSATVENSIKSFWEFSEISVSNNLEKALDDLSEKNVKDSLIQQSGEGGDDASSSLELRFEQDKAFQVLSARLKSESADLTFAVVDDDFIVQEIIKNTFQSMGSKIVAFDDGRAFMQAIPEDLDLIFLDLMMPGMNGFEVLEKLKASDKHIPIIILSALSRRETVLRAMSFGISSYITKPIKPDDVMRKTFEAVGMHL